MLERIRQLIELHGNHESFFRSVGMYYPSGSADYRLIEKAYTQTRKTCRDQKRDDGSPYFDHPRAVATIVLLYLRERDAETIAASLAHDLPEDFDKEWTHERMRVEFTDRTAELVWWITKPRVSEFSGDKERRNRHYHSLLDRAPRASMVIKLPDRLHNTLTLGQTLRDKQERKVRETQDFYLPLAERHHLLVHEIEAALDEVMGCWKSGSLSTA